MIKADIVYMFVLTGHATAISYKVQFLVAQSGFGH
jgi:hypothetical protein